MAAQGENNQKLTIEEIYSEFLKRTRAASLTFFLFFIIVALSTSYAKENPNATIAYASILLFAGVVRLIYSFWPHLFFGGVSSKSFRFTHQFLVFLCGATFGHFAFSVVRDYGVKPVSFLVFLGAAGFGAGALTSLAPLTRAIIVQLGLFLVPLTYALYTSDIPETQSYSLLFSLYFGYLILQSKVVSKDTQNAMLRLKIISSQNEELSLARDQAIQSSKMKNEFLAKMSHEVRTPLNGVIGVAEFLLNTPLNEEQRQLILSSKESGNTLLTIVNDLLDFSKIEAGQFLIELNPCNIKSHIRAFVEINQYAHKKPQVEFEVDIDEEIPEVLTTDKSRLTQILINLLDNAFKFTKSGSIKLSVKVESQHDDKFSIMFSIKDTGVGLPPNLSINIFDPFSQADSSSSREYHGTGLGLSISKKLTELLGGEIWFTRNIEGGTTFHFTIKATAMKNLSLIKPRSINNSDPSSPLNILLVEDDPMNQLLFEAYFKKLGHEYKTVENGFDAIKTLEEETFDITFMDVQLPGMDGLETTRKIRSNKNIIHQPKIIALTANAMTGDREKCLNSGMDEYLSKPLLYEDLKHAINLFTHKGKGQSASC